MRERWLLIQQLLHCIGALAAPHARVDYAVLPCTQRPALRRSRSADGHHTRGTGMISGMAASLQQPEHAAAGRVVAVWHTRTLLHQGVTQIQACPVLQLDGNINVACRCGAAGPVAHAPSTAESGTAPLGHVRPVRANQPAAQCCTCTQSKEPGGERSDSHFKWVHACACVLMPTHAGSRLMALRMAQLQCSVASYSSPSHG